jgi:NitT/TauT family transport system ATP-binding protein
MAKLVAQNVKKVFPPRIGGQEPVSAISDVTFEMEGHTFVSLVGPSGCGKSTFLNLVSGVELPTGGKLELVGNGSSEVRIGYVFQDPRLLPWRSVLDNIMYVQDQGNKQARRDRATEYLELVGLEDVGAQYPGQLSGGMQQRVGIARALANKPAVLLMDEPFGALDAQTRETMQGELLDIHNRTGKTILFVTHDLDEAVIIADRIVVMKDGRVQEIMNVPLKRPRPDLGLVRGMPEFADTRYKVWRALHDGTTVH